MSVHGPSASSSLRQNPGATRQALTRAFHRGWLIVTILLIGLHPCGAFLKKGEGNAGFYPMMAEGGSAPATPPIEASNRVALRLSPPDRPPAAGVVLVKLRKGSETADAWRNALSS